MTRPFIAEFAVVFGKTTIRLELPGSASVDDLKQQLQEKTNVLSSKQRLLLNAPVLKAMRRDPPPTASLRELFPTDLLDRVEQHGSSAIQHLKVTAMLIGNVEASPLMDVSAASEISRLSAITVEHDGGWYRCSYGRGYLRQTAFLCRTCINDGRADPQHALCLACAEFCHGTHTLEEWGVRYCMRCDCCTQKCWRPTTQGSNSEAPPTSSTEGAATAASGDSTVRVVQMRDIEERTQGRRKRSRSTSPLTPKRSHGSSPMGGIRLSTIAASSQGPNVEATEPASLSPSATGASTSFPDVPSQPRPPPHSRSSTEKKESESAEQQPVPPPVVSRCAFVIDSETGRPPVRSVLPTNRKNRYPRDSNYWCYCKDPDPKDGPDYGGIVCILCCSCFWSTHITKLHTLQYRRAPCYGDVLVGNTVVFKCLTCDTFVCPPCRLRCHKDHEVAAETFVPSKEDGSDNGAVAEAVFSCGCGGLCAIAETVPLELIDDPSTYEVMPDSAAVELINDDVFTGFLCAYCMQEYPWIASDDPLKCYNGQLPPKCTSGMKPAPPCGVKSSTETGGAGEADVFPYHGMVLPVNAFTADMTCPCEKCRSAYDVFAPRAAEDATGMVMDLHDRCDNCGQSVKDNPAFMCRTCEIDLEETFMICKDCNTLRLSCIEEQASRGGSGSAMSNHGATDTNPTHNVMPNASGDREEEAAPPGSKYDHNLSHEFFEDTFENLYALCGMQIMSNLDAEAQDYVHENWDPVADQMLLTNTITQTLGPVPLQFDEEELRESASLNQQGSTTSKQNDGEEH